MSDGSEDNSAAGLPAEENNNGDTRFESDVVTAIVPLIIESIRNSLRVQTVPDNVYQDFRKKFYQVICNRDAIGTKADGELDLPPKFRFDPVKMLVMGVRQLFSKPLLDESYDDVMDCEYPRIEMKTLLGQKRARTAPAPAPAPAPADPPPAVTDTITIDDAQGVPRAAKRDSAGYFYYTDSQMYHDLPPVARKQTYQNDVRYYNGKCGKGTDPKVLQQQEFQRIFGPPRFPYSKILLKHFKTISEHLHSHPFHIICAIERIFFGQVSHDMDEFNAKFSLDTGYRGAQMGKLLKKFKDECQPDLEYRQVPLLYHDFCNGQVVPDAPNTPYVIVCGYVLASGVGIKYFIYHPPTSTFFPSKDGCFSTLGWNTRWKCDNYDATFHASIVKQVWPTKTHPGKESCKDECRVEVLPAFFVHRKAANNADNNDSISADV